MRDAIECEALGIPSAVVIADALFGPADAMRRLSGLPGYPLVQTSFPVGSCGPAELDERAGRLAGEVVRAWCDRSPVASATAPTEVGVPGGSASTTPAAPELVEFPTEDAACEAFVDRGWTDGLPVVVPTAQRVEAMLAAAGQDPEEVLVRVPTRNNLAATVADVAVNAVMAGCTPELFAVVVAAVEALGDPAHNVHAHTGTMAGAQQLVIVNGPQRLRLGFNTADGGLGPGWRANQVVGRAVRLVVRNRLRSVHGEFDRAGFSHPGRVGWCLAEDEERSPWPPVATQAGGHLPGADAVSVYATVWQASVINHDPDAEVLLDELGLAVRTACHVNWLHQDAAADSSFHERRPFLFATGHEHARVLTRAGYGDLDRLRGALFRRLVGDDAELRPVAVAAASNLHVAYLHATGMQQTWFFAPFQSHHLVSRPVRADGGP